MLVRTSRIETRVKFAGSLDVCEFAVGGRAIGAVAAKRHRGVFEVAVGVRAIREESTKLFGLMSRFHSWRGMPSGAFPILACRTIGAWVRNVDRSTFGGCGGLMRKGAIFPRTPKVEVTNIASVVFILATILGLLVGTGVHISVNVFRVRSVSEASLLTGTPRAFDSVGQRALAASLLEGWVDCWRDKAWHQLRHHPGLLFKERH